MQYYEVNDTSDGGIFVQQDEFEQQLPILKQAVEDALALAKSEGVSGAEVAISRQQGLSVSMRKGEVDTLEFNQDGALGISVYMGHQKGSASTSDLSKEALSQAVKAAVHIASHTSEDPCNGPADKSWLATEVPDLDLYHPQAMDVEHAIAVASRAEAVALAHDPRIVNSDGATFGTHNGTRVYGNSHGFLHGYRSSRHSLSCVVIGSEGEQMQRDYGYSVARDPAALWSAEKVGEEAARKTVERLGGRKLDTCSVPVLFSPEMAGGFVSHLVAAISGSNLYRQSSFLLDQLGEKIFPEFFNITERPHLPRALGSSPFDSEGVATVERDIISDGVLQSYLLTSYAARKMGMASTGHAGGIHNWQVASTDGDQKALLQKMGKGLLVTEVMGQGVNIVTGDYSRGAAGFWVENGEIQFPVEEITIAGNLKDMFQQIVAVGNDVDYRGAMHSGSILLENMRVAGN
ncbi:metalloprotease PmbA [Corallincola holothuriorum]|uniref:metalloprotease PmbA n=1 Tax=Corallincola holothuriorum TaxID=2282215 RepID=UPI0026B2754D